MAFNAIQNNLVLLCQICRTHIIFQAIFSYNAFLIIVVYLTKVKGYEILRKNCQESAHQELETPTFDFTLFFILNTCSILSFIHHKRLHYTSFFFAEHRLWQNFDIRYIYFHIYCWYCKRFLC